MSGVSKLTILIGIFVAIISFSIGAIVTKAYLGKNTSTTPYPSTTQVLPTAQIAQDAEPTPPQFERAIDSNVIRSLSMIKKGILQKSVLSNTYQGTIIRVTTTGGVFQGSDNFKYKIMILIKNNIGEQNSFYYNDREATLMVGNVNTLKAGDNITIQETIDLQKPQTENITALSIVKM